MAGPKAPEHAELAEQRPLGGKRDTQSGVGAPAVTSSAAALHASCVRTGPRCRVRRHSKHSAGGLDCWHACDAHRRPDFVITRGALGFSSQGVGELAEKVGLVCGNAFALEPTGCGARQYGESDHASEPVGAEKSRFCGRLLRSTAAGREAMVRKDRAVLAKAGERAATGAAWRSRWQAASEAVSAPRLTVVCDRCTEGAW